MCSKVLGHLSVSCRPVIDRRSPFRRVSSAHCKNDCDSGLMVGILSFTAHDEAAS